MGKRLVIVALLSAVVAGCSSSGSHEETADPATGAQERPEVCSTVRTVFSCESVTVDGREYRYSVARRPGAPEHGADRAVLVDLGGPGRSLFASMELLDVAGAWPGDETLVFVEEPWLLAEHLPACPEALSTFYRALHEPGIPDAWSTGEAGEELAAACRLADDSRWGWSVENYRTVTEAVLDAESLDLVGVVGGSYGAVRSARLWDSPGLEWAVLNSPAPVRSTGREYLSARTEGALDAVRTGCDGCASNTAEQIMTGAVDELARRPVELATRTPLVNGVDAAAAAVALPYQGDVGVVEGVKALRNAEMSAAAIGALSDTLLMRYGGTDIAPGMLAYFQEVCRDIPGWAEPPPPGLVADFLWALHAPCAHVAAGPEATVVDPGVPVCVAWAADDRVTPAPYAQQWLAALPGALSLQLSGDRHAGPEGAIGCYQQVMQG